MLNMLNMLKMFKNQNTVIFQVTVYLRGPCYGRNFSFIAIVIHLLS